MPNRKIAQIKKPKVSLRPRTRVNLRPVPSDLDSDFEDAQPVKRKSIKRKLYTKNSLEVDIPIESQETIQPAELSEIKNLSNQIPNDICQFIKTLNPGNINASEQLTDSSEDENESKCKTIPLESYEQFDKTLSIAKNQFTAYKREVANAEVSTSIDIKTLLEIGEDIPCDRIPLPLPIEDNSDSDEWQDVEEKISTNSTECIQVVAKEPVPIKKDNRLNCFLATLKTAINKKKRKLQHNLHKTHILGLIAHGNYLNDALCNPELHQLCKESFKNVPKLPSNQSMNANYINLLIDWFYSTMKLESARWTLSLSKLPKLLVSLALQIQYRSVTCKRDFLLIFIAIVRSLGFNCRLVINLVTLPIRPLQNDLCPIKIDEWEKSDRYVWIEAPEKLRYKPPESSANLKAPRNPENINVSSATISLTAENIRKITKPFSIRSKRITLNTSIEEKKKKLQKNRKLTINRTKENPSEIKIDKNQIKLKPKPFSRTKENVGSPLVKNSNEIPRKTMQLRHKKETFQLAQLDGIDDISLKRSRRIRKLENQKSKLDNEFASIDTSSSDEDDSDFEVSPPKRRANNKYEKPPIIEKSSKKFTDTKTNNSNESIDYWLEIYCPKERAWICVNLFKLKINSLDHMRKYATKPIRYVFGWSGDRSIKDISSRYCQHWNTATRLLRTSQSWIDDTLRPFKQPNTEIDQLEDVELNKFDLAQTLPKIISEYKNHPLYVLQRHLLKFEVLYPPNPLVLGYIRNEAVYSRDCVYTCQSRESWFRQARVVRAGEQPYKVVRDRPKWEGKTRTIITNLSLDIFGIWQTDPYEPPVAKDGIVPRNAYGNVDFYLPEMLPKNTVHLRLPGLSRTCKKMDIDCANAFIGWNFKGTKKPPSPFDGYVICAEFKEQVIKQYEADQQEAERKEMEKRNERIYGNWKKLIKGLLIRQRLQRKYNFQTNAVK